MNLSKNHIKQIFTESVNKVLRESTDFNIKNVYHVSDSYFDEFKISSTTFPYIFFSSKPIFLTGADYLYTCNLSIHNPLVFSEAPSWSYPLWLFLSDKDGHLIPEEQFTKKNYDGYLNCPYEFWKAVYYDDEEYDVDQIPQLVKSLNLSYDSVIITNVQEGDNQEHVDDYIVFDPNQIQITNVTKRNISNRLR